MMMYDSFSSDYDRFVSWPGRLAFELPFLEQFLSGLPQPVRVMDAAAGTGMHTLALAQRGYAAAGADLSTGMVARARQNAAQAGRTVRFEAAGFGELAAAFGPHSFDALLCLGNSLPHLLTPQALAAALADFAAVLHPGGRLLIQNRNFDAVLARRERFMEPQAHREGEAEWIFQRFYDYDPDGLITFNILTLHRPTPDSSWQQAVTTTRLAPQLESELSAALRSAGFEHLCSFGSMDGSAFDPAASGNLILSAVRA
ncbi:class I SAM-dependent methyltransferase [Levilinea saccharolytica]|uniref:class I SAM-dependent methyltransferase n=1 Tax=Levilinea saccharolytica TaxID=229921 RepID=UPI000784A8F2|nr:class I SAM-dependent methyltransferase [Levilinea saccharolytica]GAP16497.1 protein containing methyltransferase domain [Levilinea saccharolytica]